MTDRIKLVSTQNYNQNSPTKIPKTQPKLDEREFLRIVSDSREKVYLAVDNYFEDFVKTSLSNFQKSGMLPEIKNDVKGLTKVNEGIETYLKGERVLRETQKKLIFSESENKFPQVMDEDFPYKTLSKPQVKDFKFTPSKVPKENPKNILIDEKYEEEEIHRGFVENDFNAHVFQSERKIKRLGKGKSDSLNDTIDSQCQRQFVGSFIPGSKKFIFVNLKDEQLQIQGIFLEINFKIPLFSKVVVTRNGDYLLSGGVQDGKVINNLYSLLFNQRTLNNLSAMETPRARHSIIFLQKTNSLLVVGGVSDIENPKPLKSCELFDIGTGKWSNTGKMNFVSMESSLVEREDYVYKIGGQVDEFTSSNYIERYSIKEGTWEIVGYDTVAIDNIFLRLANKAGGFSCGASIIIFGGTVHKVRCNAAYKLEVSKAKPTLEEWKPIILAGPIISPVVAFKGEFFALQDIGLDLETGAQDLSKKKLVIFSDEKWESVL